jgi:hypothetical protein
MRENPANRESSRHVGTHCLRELVRDGHVKLFKCAMETPLETVWDQDREAMRSRAWAVLRAP